MRPNSALTMLAALVVLAAGHAGAQGFKFSQPDTSGQAE